MKYFLIIFSLLFSLCCFAQEQTKTAQELFDEGNYLGAVAEYQKLIDSGNKNSYTYYNLANSYFKAGDLDKAIVNYYRAFRLNPRDKDIINNLSFALKKTGQTLIPESMPKSVFLLYNYFSLSEIKGLAFICLWLVAISFTFFVSFKYRPFLLKILIVNLCLLILFTGYYFFRSKQDLQELAVVVAPRAELRSGPSENFPVALNVPRAQLLKVNDKKGDWLEVTTDSGNTFTWVQKKYIEII
ncbi:MAG: tetratricopeptide repeat protein [Elusimicrobiaceae bacterium]|nr:tetratricopeptide repeat protein [Elusimicrobiaceae bacterium]